LSLFHVYCNISAVSLIASLTQGVYEWSTDLPGQAETSDNIGIVKTESGALDATTFARSFDPATLVGVQPAARKVTRPPFLTALRHEYREED
jgi:di/tripeptidase